MQTAFYTTTVVANRLTKRDRDVDTYVHMYAEKEIERYRYLDIHI